MKKTFLSVILLAICTVVSAQNKEKFYGTFDHLGADVSVGTQGVGIDLATPVTSYLEVSFGVNIMPGFKVNGDVNVGDIPTQYGNINVDKVNIEADFARTTWDFKVSCYPFGEKNNFFVAAGLSFGADKIAKLNGHSDKVRDAIVANPALKDQIYAEIDKYNVKFDSNGDIDGYLKVRNVRPYVGIGYGRLVPKHRLGVRVELGCQFEDKMKVYSNDSEVDTSAINDTDDDISKVIDKFTVYPVFKIALTGRIF